MTDDSASLRERVEALERCVSELSRAAVRISAILDPDAVLQEVVDSARSLTGARYGLTTTVDEAGWPQRFVGSGITAAEHRRLQDWADGPRLFEHLTRLPGPLRCEDERGGAGGLGADDLPERLPHLFKKHAVGDDSARGLGSGLDRTALADRVCR